jgi:hypothetical protein
VRLELSEEAAGEHGYWTVLGAAQALAHSLAAELEVPAAEIGANASRPSAGAATILLHDAVPGGAMLTTQLMDDELFGRVLTRAMERTDGRCGCGHADSCSACLRWQENRFAHMYLRRGAVHALLASMRAEPASPPPDTA